MRISDWSSDVCSSDLFEVAAIGNPKFLQRGDRGDRCKIGLILDPPDIGFGLSVQKGVQRQIADINAEIGHRYPSGPSTKDGARIGRVNDAGERAGRSAAARDTRIGRSVLAAVALGV